MNQRVIDKVFDNLDLNSRIELGLEPRRISPEIISNLESKFPRPELVYLSESKLLINFHMKFFGHVLSRPLDLDWRSDDPEDFTMFNMYGKEYIAELICDCGQCMVLVRDQPWITDLNVKVI
jgi:hypothetical protein